MIFSYLLAIERLWHSLKYECIYLHIFETGSEVRRGINKWMPHYNDDRPPENLPAVNYDENNDIYLNLGQGCRAPQATELCRLQRAQTVAELKKVSLKNIEIGFRGQQDIVRYNISFYVMKKDNYIFRDSAFFNVGNGKSDHIGADVMVKLTVSDQLSLKANASFARHRYAFDYISRGVNLRGKDIDTAPRYFGSMQLVWKPVNGFRTELEWVHMGAYSTDPENRHKYETS